MNGLSITHWVKDDESKWQTSYGVTNNRAWINHLSENHAFDGINTVVKERFTKTGQKRICLFYATSEDKARALRKVVPNLSEKELIHNGGSDEW